MIFTLCSMVLALVMHLSFLKEFHFLDSEHLWPSYVLIASVGFIYFLDRWWDASHSHQLPKRKRTFLLRPGVFFSYCLLLSCVIVYGVFQLSWTLILAGLGLTSIVALYLYVFVYQGSPAQGGFKESAIALLFASGVSLSSWSYLDVIPWQFWIDYLSTALLIFHGLILISEVDQSQDQINRMPNIYNRFPQISPIPLRLFLVLIQCMLILVGEFASLTLICTLSAGVFLEGYYFICKRRQWDQSDYFHAGIDLSMSLPLIIYLGV